MTYMFDTIILKLNVVSRRIFWRDCHSIWLPECRERAENAADMMKSISRENVDFRPENIFSYDVQQVSRNVRGTILKLLRHSRPTFDT